MNTRLRTVCLPKDIQQRKTEHFTASANDAFAAIRITARDSTEECYAEILDYLCAVLEQEEFPRSYSVEFRGKEKLYLPSRKFFPPRAQKRNRPCQKLSETD